MNEPTAEPYYPIPPDEPYGALGSPETSTRRLSTQPPLPRAGGVSGDPSAPTVPQAEGALTFHCPACLLEWDENYCSFCGAENLKPTIDRPVHHPIPETVHGPDGSEV